MRIANVKLKNEFIMAPVKTGYSNNEGIVKKEHLKFYKKRTQDIGAIIPEPFYLDSSLREIPTQMGIDNEDKIEGLKKLTEVIHEGKTKAIAHLNHPGRMANPKMKNNIYYSSTDKPCHKGEPRPKRMDKNDIKEAQELFVDAAIRAEKANFDMIELQFGHGYLAAQFISDKVNDRNDKYGGNFENRIRFAVEVLNKVKKEVNLPIIVRISGDEMIKDGIQLKEMKDFVKILEEDGADAIHVSAGTICDSPPWYFQHMFIPKGKTWEMAQEIKNEINIPVIAVGKINETKDINKIKENNMADFIAIGRPLVADPNFISKYHGKNENLIRPCLSCTSGCLGGVKSGKGLQCLVNPQVGQDVESIKAAEERKNYAVVGGGLAGMKSALTLKEKGHTVTIYEKDELGGQFNLAPLPPNKNSMKKINNYYKQKINLKNIKVIKEKPINDDLINNYDGVILATGSEPTTPPIPGIDEIDYYWAEILKENELPKNKNVFIIGGGLIGIDIATSLIKNNNKVTIVKRTTDFGENMEMITKKISLNMLKKNDVTFSNHTNIKKIEKDTVYAEKEGEKIKFENIDVFVVSTGLRSVNSLKKELENDIPVYLVGDAKKPGNAQDAIYSAYKTANNL